MFAFPTDATEFSKTEGKLQNEKASGIDGVSAEVLKTSLLMIVFILIVFLISLCQAVGS